MAPSSRSTTPSDAGLLGDLADGGLRRASRRSRRRPWAGPRRVRPAGRMRQTSRPASVRTTTPPADVLSRGPVMVLECSGACNDASVVYRSERPRPHGSLPAAAVQRGGRRACSPRSGGSSTGFRRIIVRRSGRVAFVAGLVGHVDLPGELKGGGFTDPATPSQQAPDGDAGAPGLRPGAAHDRVRQRQPRRAQRRVPGAGEARPLGHRPQAFPGSARPCRPPPPPATRASSPRTGSATFAVLVVRRQHRAGAAHDPRRARQAWRRPS